MSDPALLALDLAEARDGLARKLFSARELTAAYNDAVVEAKPLNAYITPTPERALAMADASDGRLARGEALPLDGIPVAASAARAATAAAEPPEEPPGTSGRLSAGLRHGFSTGPYQLVVFEEPIANSSRLVLPSMTAPDCHSFSVTVDS